MSLFHFFVPFIVFVVFISIIQIVRWVNKQNDEYLDWLERMGLNEKDDKCDIAGGKMWGKKSDQTISYYRPNLHLDKSDTQLEVGLNEKKDNES